MVGLLSLHWHSRYSSVFLGSGKRHLSPLVPRKLVGYCSVTFPLSQPLIKINSCGCYDWSHCHSFSSYFPFFLTGLISLLEPFWFITLCIYISGFSLAGNNNTSNNNHHLIEVWSLTQAADDASCHSVRHLVGERVPTTISNQQVQGSYNAASVSVTLPHFCGSIWPVT